MKGLGARMARQPTSHLCSGMLKHSSELIHPLQNLFSSRVTKKTPEVNLRFPLCSWRLGLPLAFILSGIMVYITFI